MRSLRVFRIIQSIPSIVDVCLIVIFIASFLALYIRELPLFFVVNHRAFMLFDDFVIVPALIVPRHTIGYKLKTYRPKPPPLRRCGGRILQQERTRERLNIGSALLFIITVFMFHFTSQTTCSRIKET